MVDSIVKLKSDTTIEKINEAVMDAANSAAMKGVLEYSTLPVVSTDIIGNPHSSIYDAPYTKVVGGNMVKTVNWYDNEWGYSNRVVDLIDIFKNMK